MEKVTKRAFDMLSSFLGLLLLSPVFMLIAAAIKLEDEGPVMFSQIRMGREFMPFKLYKFRTMEVNADEEGAAITVKGDSRVTRIGSILRKYKLDELPQLVNVFKGDMSIVGPRPEAPQFVEIFCNDYQTILEVKPGITDYATLEFRSEEDVLASYDEPEKAYIDIVLPRKIELSKQYIAEQSLFLDCRIVIRTLLAIAFRDT